MRKVIIAAGIVLSIVPASAEDKPSLSASEKARVLKQIEAAQQSKLNAASSANASLKSQALSKGQAIDQTVKGKNAKVDKAAESLSWYYGKDLATAAGAAKKKQLEAQAAAEKQKIADDAKRRAAEHNAAANKAVQNINESVTGLKSQVAKKGEFGLQPKGTNLNVRNYGTTQK
jgi:hypothetical protein